MRPRHLWYFLRFGRKFVASAGLRNMTTKRRWRIAFGMAKRSEADDEWAQLRAEQAWYEANGARPWNPGRDYLR